jgi:hypothetical protein
MPTARCRLQGFGSEKRRAVGRESEALSDVHMRHYDPKCRKALRFSDLRAVAAGSGLGCLKRAQPRAPAGHDAARYGAGRCAAGLADWRRGFVGGDTHAARASHGDHVHRSKRQRGRADAHAKAQTCICRNVGGACGCRGVNGAGACGHTEHRAGADRTDWRHRASKAFR